MTDAMLTRLRANAAASRAVIEAGGVGCVRCRRIHPPTYRYRGRERDWHAQGDAQMSPERIRAREAQIGGGR